MGRKAIVLLEFCPTMFPLVLKKKKNKRQRIKVVCEIHSSVHASDEEDSGLPFYLLAAKGVSGSYANTAK